MSLVLTRRKNETIIIGDDVRVTVVNIGQGQVKLAIDAPHSVTVDRLEIRQRKDREGKE